MRLVEHRRGDADATPVADVLAADDEDPAIEQQRRRVARARRAIEPIGLKFPVAGSYISVDESTRQFCPSLQ